MGKHDSVNGVGYNDADCMKIDQGIENVYDDTIAAINEEITNQICVPIGQAWYSELAVEYMKTFQTNCGNASDDVRTIFQNFRDQMQENITTWRTQTQAQGGSDLQDVAQKQIEIDISSVKETDAEGNRYITNTLETDLDAWIVACRTSIVSRVATSVSSNTVGSFIGENQNEAINDAMITLADKINEILCFLNTGDNSILTEITNYRSQYTTTGQNNASTTQSKDYGAGADVTGGADDS